MVSGFILENRNLRELLNAQRRGICENVRRVRNRLEEEIGRDITPYLDKPLNDHQKIFFAGILTDIVLTGGLTPLGRRSCIDALEEIDKP